MLRVVLKEISFNSKVKIILKHRIPQWAKNGSLVYQRFQRRSLGKVILMLPFPYGTLKEKKDTFIDTFIELANYNRQTKKIVSQLKLQIQK